MVRADGAVLISWGLFYTYLSLKKILHCRYALLAFRNKFKLIKKKPSSSVLVPGGIILHFLELLQLIAYEKETLQLQAAGRQKNSN